MIIQDIDFILKDGRHALIRSPKDTSQNFSEVITILFPLMIIFHVKYSAQINMHEKMLCKVLP